MEHFETEIQQDFVKKLKYAITENFIEIKQNDRWSIGRNTNIIDIVIYRGFFPFAVVEIKQKLKEKSNLTNAVESVRAAIILTNSRFGIVTDNNVYYLYDKNRKSQDFEKVSFEKLVNRITRPSKIKSLKKNKETISDIIRNTAKKHLPENHEFLSFIDNNLTYNCIEFDERINSYVFAENCGDILSFENKFFNKMFGEFKDKRICRYTSLGTAFAMLNNLSLRMNGLLGMNDKSEVNYVENYFSRKDNTLSIAKPIIKEPRNTITELNKRYITSCTKISKKDDLTLWRLYGDDAKGVCLVYDVNKNNLNDNVILQKVKYADKDGNHKELDFLAQIKLAVEQSTNLNFKFQKLDYWKHFFKANDYRVENEVRLLIIDNDTLTKIKTDWVMTYTHSIFNPLIEFKLNSSNFPIQLKLIVLGPKCPEQETNFVQINEMILRKQNEISTHIEDNDLGKLEVELSNIKHYR
jgi:hypothetical protein